MNARLNSRSRPASHVLSIKTLCYDQRRIRARHNERAFTLMEMLITLSIIGLIIVLLVITLRPSDDRRCRLEAERLAAYLSGAANEAKMRSGAVRVNFDFAGQGSAQRQITELQVESTQIGWRDQGKVHTIDQPVKLTEVETHLNGISTNGDQNFFLFRSSYTPGGVARLVLKKVMYSVIVPSNGEPPRVELGRGKLPPLPQAHKGHFKRPLNFNESDVSASDQAQSSSRSSDLSGTSSSGSLGTSLGPRPMGNPSQPPSRSPSPQSSPEVAPPPPEPPTDDESEDPICGDGSVDDGEECDDGNDDDQDACLNNCEKATCGDGILRLDLDPESGGEECDDGDDVDTNSCTNQCQVAICGDGIVRDDLDPRDEGYEECDDGNTSPGDGCNADCQSECTTDLDCQEDDERGPWGACNQETRTCQLKIPAFQLASITNVAVTDGGITANIEQPAIAAELRSSLQDWVITGKLILVVSVGEFGQTYEYAHQAPSAYFFQGQQSGLNVVSRQDLPVYRYEPNYQDCSVNGVFDHCYTSGKAIISLYIRLLGSSTCEYQVLTLNTQLSVSAKPGQRAQVTLTGYLTPRDARMFMLAQSLSLADALDGIEPTVDCNGDPKKEAWAITITGEATESELGAPPLGSAPAGCPQAGGGDDCNPPPDDEEIQALLDASCVRCHGGDDQRGDLSLEAPFREKVLNVVATTQDDIELVSPRDYEGSLLYQLAGESHGGNRVSFSPASLTRLKEWILGL